MTVSTDHWCETVNDDVGKHKRTVITALTDRRSDAVDIIAEALPSYYVSLDRLADILAKHGQDAAAKYVREKLPEGVKPRSGDMGEIIACAHLEAATDYRLAILKFRWSDSREMAMRGDDFLGVRLGRKRLHFLKGEAKSRKALKTKDVKDARSGLETNDGLPAPHALSFVADRLYEAGEADLSDRIDNAGLLENIRTPDVKHMLFTLSGNAPGKFLKADLTGYVGENAQMSVGVHIPDHAEFIKDVFEAASGG